MRLKNKQIVEAQEALTKLLNTPLPVKQAYLIKKTIESIKKQVAFIEGQRNDLIKKYGIEENGNYSIPENDAIARDNFFADYKELLELDEEIDVRQLTLDELDRVELTVNELESVEFILKIEE